MSQESNNNFSGLKSIFLNNSIFPGLLTQIRCDGHTVNFGNNGAGKTSILNLIPIFYGLRPNKLISQRGNKLSFVDYYLPYSTSMIVFEYRKKGQTKNVIIFRHNESYRYCFIEGSADELLFTQESKSELKKLNSTQVWIKQYLQINKQAYVSKMIDNADVYQAVLMNNRDIISSQKDRNALALLVSHFSLCNIDSEIRNLSSLTAVMLSERSKLLNELKEMLVMCYVQEQVNILIPKTSQGRTHLEELQAASELETHIKDFYKTIDLKSKIADDWGFITQSEYKLKTISEAYKKERNDLKTKLSGKKEDLIDLSNSFKQILNDLTTKLDLAEIEKISKSSIIKEYEDQKEKWDVENIAEKIAEYNQLTVYQENLDQQEDQLKQIKKDFNDKIIPIDQKKLKSLLSLNKDKTKLLSKLTKDLEKKNNELSEIENRFKSMLANLEYSSNTQIEAAKNQLDSKKEELEQKLINLADNLVLNSKLLPEEQATLDKVEDELKEYQEKITSNLKSQSSKQEEISTIKESIKDSEKTINSLVVKRDFLYKQKEEVLLLLNPPQTSVIGFLENNLTSWRDNIGKVLRKDVLYLKGLKPYLVNNYENNSNSIFGLCFDLEQVDTPEYIYRRQEIEERSIKLDEEISSVISMITKNESSLKDLKNKLNTIQIDLSILKREEQTLISNQQLAISNKEALTAEYNKNRQKRINDVNNDILDTKNSRTSYEKKFISYKDNVLKYKKDRTIQLQADENNEKEPIKLEIKSLSNRINGLDAEFEEKAYDIEENYKEQLNQAGINYSILKKAETAVDNAQKKYDLVSSYKTLIQDYSSFISGQYSQMPKLREDLAKAEDEIEKYNNELAVEKEKQKEKKSVIDNEIASLGNQITELTNSIDLIEDFFSTNQANLARKRPELKDKDYVPENLNIVSMIAKCNENFKTINKNQDLLVKNVDAVRKTMENQTGAQNRIGGYWRNIIESIKTKFGDEYEEVCNTIPFYFELTDRLAYFISTEFNAIKVTITESFVSSAAKFTNFYESLRHFNQVVQKVSSSFEKRLLTYNPLDTITDIKIGLVSKVLDLDIYPKLSNFDKCYKEWEENRLSRNELVQPSEDLIRYYSQVSECLLNNEIDSDLNSLIDIKISMKINGRQVNVRSDRDLTSGGSTGESKLAINVIFCGLTRMLCPDENIKIHWPIDEIGEIYNDNLHKIFDMTEQYGIFLFCAQPNLSYDKVPLFKSKNNISKFEGVKRCVESYEEEQDNPLIEMLAHEVEA